MDSKSPDELLQNDRFMGQTMILPDGRTLSYSESGDPNGHPVILCIGLMASSLAVVLFHEEALRKNLRILAMDYPGIGDSSPQLDRKLQDWPADVEAFCTAILGRNVPIRLLAHSMGGPHALACLHQQATVLQNHKIISATLVSPWLFQFQPTVRHLPVFVQESILPRLATAWTTSTLSVAGSVVSSSADASSNVRLTQKIVGYSHKQGPAGNHCMVRLALTESIPSFASVGSSDVMIHVCCGEKDHLVSDNACRELAEEIGASSYSLIPGADHNSIMSKNHLSDILSTILIE